MTKKVQHKKLAPWKEKIHTVIFEADTPMGKVFDVSLMVLIIVSVLTVMLESVESISAKYGLLFEVLEWTFTILFTIEYILRLICVYNALNYAKSFYGIIDLVSTLPSYLTLVLPHGNTQYFVVIRALRLLRIFRIFKLGHFLKEGKVIVEALKASKAKITVFVVFVLLMVTIVGSIIYLIEAGEGSKFNSIPRSIYWAIVTITTVGYGDISPETPLGQFFAAVLMIMGYAIIAVPTGIVTNELMQASSAKEMDITTRSCKDCTEEGHDSDAVYCKYCGEEL